MRIAAIDLGTHNCRLLVAQQTANGFRTVKATSKIVRLGEGAAKTRKLQPEAVERTLNALKNFSGIIVDERSNKVHCVATEACRMADNCDEFIEKVRDHCGLDFTVIPAVEEVRLSALANFPLIEKGVRRVMTLDIGGGSTELVLLDYDGDTLRVIDCLSLPIGVVRGRDIMETAEINGEEFATMTAVAAIGMTGFFDRNSEFFKNECQLIGSSGTVTTLAAMLKGHGHYQRHRIDGLKCRVDDMVALAEKAALSPLAERHANPLMGSDRAEYMPPGCAIFNAILSQIPAEYITIADRGLREGIINSYLADAPKVVFQKTPG